MLNRRRKTADFEREALPHLHDLYRTATRMVGDGHVAEDLVQEAYMRAWRSFDRYERNTNCRAWLFRILINVIRHYRRKTFKIQLVPTDTVDLEETIASPPSISSSLGDHRILEALDELPDHYREVAILADVEDFTYREIAGILEVPIGTVMSRLSRARALLRAALRTVAPEYGVSNGTRVGR